MAWGMKPGTSTRPASVYLLYDADDVLLYVGMTTAGMWRFNEHMGSKPWWHDVRRAEFKHCLNEYRARVVEGLLIRDLNPMHNIIRPLNLCTVCNWQKAASGGRCHTCLSYYRRRGEDRPEWLIVRHARRVQEKGRPKPRSWMVKSA